MIYEQELSWAEFGESYKLDEISLMQYGCEICFADLKFHIMRYLFKFDDKECRSSHLDKSAPSWKIERNESICHAE